MHGRYREGQESRRSATPDLELESLPERCEEAGSIAGKREYRLTAIGFRRSTMELHLTATGLGRVTEKSRSVVLV